MRKTFSVKTLRAALDLSQSSLAEMFGVTQATISRWETGEAEPSGPAQILLARFSKETAQRLHKTQ